MIRRFAHPNVIKPGMPAFIVILGLLLGGALAVTPSPQSPPPPDWEYTLTSMGLVDVQLLHSEIRVDLKYSTTDNFLGLDVYGALEKCFLQKEAARKLAAAQDLLTSLKPGWHLLIFDGARPRRIQVRMWEIVKDTPQREYVANPANGSIHNYGAAVDLTILKGDGHELDMGTPFDYFGDLAQPRLEEEFLKQGKLSEEQVGNRRLLRKVMNDAGFRPISVEWWHFDAFPREEVKKRFAIIE
ncbi:MAG: M15 family metallopeptidase [Candidatus Aminicenantes bacterium]|nr:M15 family metallopeptidase [Candidatus Aminicenantes bacterium]